MSARVALALVAEPEVQRPADTPATPGRVYNLGPAERVAPGEGRSCWVAGREIAIFRDRRRQFFASQAWCPHHFGSLGEGAVGYGEVACPLHGLRFDLRSGAPRGHDCGTLRTYPVRISRDGDILVTVE